MERPSSSAAYLRSGAGYRATSGVIRGLGTMSRIRSSQKRVSAVRTRPFSGIAFGRTTSKAEIRSVATMRSVSPSTAYTSRTLPRRTSLMSEKEVWTTVIMPSLGGRELVLRPADEGRVGKEVGRGHGHGLGRRHEPSAGPPLHGRPCQRARGGGAPRGGVGGRRPPARGGLGGCGGAPEPLQVYLEGAEQGLVALQRLVHRRDLNRPELSARGPTVYE